MSWLSGLAGKAEDFLNKIDHNAAIALQKDTSPQYRAKDDVLVEVTGDAETGHSSSYSTHPVRQSISSYVPAVKSYPILTSAVGSSSAKNVSGKTLYSRDDDELMRYLNSPKTEKGKSRKTASINAEIVNGSGVSTASPSRKSPHAISPKHAPDIGGNYRQVPKKDEVSVEVIGIDDAIINNALEFDHDVDSLNEENGVLKRELQSTEQETYLLRKKLKESQRDMEVLQERLNNAEDRLKEVQGMYTAAVEDNKKITEAASLERFQTQADLERSKNELALSVDDKTRALKVLKEKMEAEINAAKNKTISLQKRYDSLVEELRNERVDQERYRARAQAVLAGRDREIAELRGRKDKTQEVSDESSEFQNLESEKERHRWEEEIFDLKEQVANLNAALDEGRRQWNKDREEAEDELIIERGRREAAEEETKAAIEELKSTKDEVMKCRHLEMELRQKISKLRKVEEAKVGSSSVPQDGWKGGRVPTAGESVRDAVEDSLSARLAALTSTLVEKQVRVESLTAERNALRLQLEKTDHLYRDALTHLGQVPNGSLAGQNDTDDVKARIPSFLLESPFDTAVARRVKRAYSSLDAVGVRFGIFLRRYPLARTLLLSYTVLLHLWVVVVLLTYTPDAH